MKNILLLTTIILFVGLQGPTNAQWFAQNVPSQNNLEGIFAIDEDTVISVGSIYPNGGGIILKTTDGGENWLINLVDTLGYYLSIYFVNQDIGWVGGWYPFDDWDIGIILKTTNAGNNWIKDTLGIGPLNSIHFVDQNTGWAAGMSVIFAILHKTTDAGINWISQRMSCTILASVFFIDQNTGWVIGGQPWEGSILRTTDGGISWITKTFSSFMPRSIYFIDPNIGWAAGRENFTNFGLIYKTTDGGENWVNQLVGVNSILNDIYFINENTGWTVGLDGIILCTTNGGLNWITQVSSTSDDLYSVHFINNNTGWAVGENGTILKTTNGGIIPVELISFTAIAQSNYVELKWSTATELNNYGFEIERSSDKTKPPDGKAGWKRIGFREGKGTTSEPQQYSYTDNLSDVASSKLYYRLKQIDFDGSYEYSDIVEVEIAPAVFSLSQNYPNPFNPSTTIEFALPAPGFVTLSIFNILGEKVATLVSEELTAGSYKYHWDATELTSGIYFYRIQTGLFVEIKKMLLLK